MSMGQTRTDDKSVVRQVLWIIAESPRAVSLREVRAKIRHVAPKKVMQALQSLTKAGVTVHREGRWAISTDNGAAYLWAETVGEDAFSPDRAGVETAGHPRRSPNVSRQAHYGARMPRETGEYGGPESLSQAHGIVLAGQVEFSRISNSFVEKIRANPSAHADNAGPLRSQEAFLRAVRADLLDRLEDPLEETKLRDYYSRLENIERTILSSSDAEVVVDALNDYEAVLNEYAVTAQNAEVRIPVDQDPEPARSPSPEQSAQDEPALTSAPSRGSDFSSEANESALTYRASRRPGTAGTPAISAVTKKLKEFFDAIGPPPSWVPSNRRPETDGGR